MAEGDTDQKVKRSVRRTLAGFTLFLLVAGGLLAWGSLGLYTLKPGQAAVVLVLGKHSDTVLEDGLHWMLPPPFGTRDIVEFQELRNEDFGFRGDESEKTSRAEIIEATMQTADNNIVRVPFAVQYDIKDPFFAEYRIAERNLVVRDAAQAAMREVVGRMTVDGVLREKRALVTAETARILQDILDLYESGVRVKSVELQNVQPPAGVRAAFDDVVAANQDAERLVNEAEGYRNELMPSSRAEAAELIAAAEAYRDVKVAVATGEAQRFTAVAVEYKKAPEVTQKRLYLETMEAVLPKVDKVIIESGTTQVLPYLPLRDGRKAQ